MGASAYNLAVGSDDAVALRVEAEDADGSLSFVVGAPVHGSVVHDVSLSVLVEEERGVDAVNLWQCDGVAPAFARVFCLHEEVAHSHVCGDHVERLVLLVVRDGRCKNASADALTLQRQLFRTVEHVSYLRPVHQVGALEDGHSGVERERRVDQIVVVASPAERGVGIESGQYRVQVLVCGIDLLIETGVVARVLEIGEVGILCHCRGDTSQCQCGCDYCFFHVCWGI